MEDVLIRTNQLPNWVDEKYFRGTDLASIDDLIGVIEDLRSDLDILQDEYDDFKKQVEDNYKPLSQAELIGWSEEW